MNVSITEALNDPNLLRPYLLGKKKDLSSWRRWNTCLRVMYGLDVGRRGDLIRKCTGRDPAKLPAGGFDENLILTGRRSGKSRIAGGVAAYEAVLAGVDGRLDPGETGLVCVISPTRRQSRIVRDYIRAAFTDSPLLRDQIASETKELLTLKNGVEIATLTGDWRSVRGFSLLAVILDECCFIGVEEEAAVRSDTELVRALRPSLATTKGRLVAISSPYAKQGWAYRTHERCFGNDEASTLVWNAASRVMNPTLSQAVVDRAMQEDPAAARAEYLAQFRDDIASYVPRETVLACVKAGRSELPPRGGTKYFAFCDLSGGRSDDAALCIGHRDENRVVIDLLRRWQPPFDPRLVVHQMATQLETYGLRRCHGDHYGGEYTARGFEERRISYLPAPKAKSELYLDLLPLLAAREIVLPDDRRLIDQISSLERRTRSGGRDTVDHPRGLHDDVANVVAGLASVATGKQPVRIGGF